MMIRVIGLTLIVFVLFSGLAFGQNPEFTDVDRDGVDDNLEQDLLVRFVPSLMIDSGECDAKPAEFKAGADRPEVVARNGTIYGQVMPTAAESGTAIEIHYYHLWSRDCGLLGHALDPEHVSVRIRADQRNDPASKWRAQYWYAAAHEGTLCAASSGALASVLDAEEHGASIWVSRGKHGSFLSPARCRLGCGGDRCESSGTPMTTRVIMNIGEPNAPMNGALWSGSTAWTLQSKMKSDFGDDIQTRIESSESPDGIILLDTPTPPTKALLLGGNSTLEAFLLGNEQAARAIVIGAVPSARSTVEAIRKTGESLELVGERLRGLLSN